MPSIAFDLSAALRSTGLTIESLLDPQRPLTRDERAALGVSAGNEEVYLQAFRKGYELGDEFFPRVAPRGDYMLGWNHGRDARAMQRALVRH